MGGSETSINFYLKKLKLKNYYLTFVKNFVIINNCKQLYNLPLSINSKILTGKSISQKFIFIISNHVFQHHLLKIAINKHISLLHPLFHPPYRFFQGYLPRKKLETKVFLGFTYDHGVTCNARIAVCVGILKGRREIKFLDLR